MSLLLIELDPEKLSQLFKSVLLIVENVIFVYSLHVRILIFQATNHCLGMALYMFSETAVICAFENVNECLNFSIRNHFVRGCLAMLVVPRMLLRNRIQGPISTSQSISNIKTTEVNFYIFSGPYLFKHRVKFLLDIDIILQAELDFLFAFKYFFVLIFEHYRAEIIKFGKQRYQIFMLFQMQRFEETWNNFIVVVYKLVVKSRIEGQRKRDLAFFHTINIVDEGADVFFFN